MKCGFPQKINIEVTNMCNHSCIFCAHSKCTKKQMMINEEFAKRIIDEAYVLGAKEVGFYLCGEPLMNPKLESYIGYAKRVGYDYTFITSNGALLSIDRFASLCEAGLDSIRVSINAANENDYKAIHGRDDFSRVITNIIEADKYRKNYNLDIGISVSTIITDYSRDAGELLRTKLKDYIDNIYIYKCVNQGGIMFEINDVLTIDGKSNGLANSPGDTKVCTMPFKNVYISCDGMLTICCTDFQNYLTVADLNKESLENAWNNDRIQEIRRRHFEQNLVGTLCYNCINNCNTHAEPIMPEVAFPVDLASWTSVDSIKKRLEMLRKR